MFSKPFPSDRSTRRPKAKVDSAISESEHLETTNEYNKPWILIAGENSDFTKALSKRLVTRGFSCCDTDNEEQVFSLFLLKRPVVTVISFKTKEKNGGIKAATDILKTSSRAEIVVLTDSISKVTEAEKIGVELFVRRDLGLTKIIDMICVVSNLKKPACKLVSR